MRYLYMLNRCTSIWYSSFSLFCARLICRHLCCTPSSLGMRVHLYQLVTWTAVSVLESLDPIANLFLVFVCMLKIQT
jgi:hypothetical protein